MEKKKKARTKVRRGKESLPCDPGSDFQMFNKTREKKKEGEDNKWDGKKKKPHVLSRHWILVTLGWYDIHWHKNCT